MKNKFMSFIKQNGFLLFLFICVCVVAAGTIYIATQDMRIAEEPIEEDLVILEEIKDDEEKENVEVSSIEESIVKVETDIDETQEEAEVVLEDSEDIMDVSEDPVIEENLTEDEAIEEVINEDEIEYVDDYEEEENVQIVANQSLGVLPVDGKIITEFSSDKLIFSSTLEEWRAHHGIDIGAAEGAKVKAPMAGIIKEIREDDLWGIIIVIDHGDGLQSKLSNLGTMEMVKEGLEVNRGDFISTVGATANIEMAMGSHVHFEVTKNGKIVDPRSITN